MRHGGVEASNTWAHARARTHVRRIHMHIRKYAHARVRACRRARACVRACARVGARARVGVRAYTLKRIEGNQRGLER